MLAADVAITSSSQAGLEFLSLHKPLILLGKAFYAGLPGTISPHSYSGLAEAIDDLAHKDSPLRSFDKGVVDSYIYQYINDYLVPFDRQVGRFTAAGFRMIENIILGRNRLFGLR